MSGISGACFRVMGDFLQALGGLRSTNSVDPKRKPAACSRRPQGDGEDLMLRALTAVFGMEGNGRINKEKARQVVEKLGLMADAGFDLDLLPPAGGSGEKKVAGVVEEVLGEGFIEGGPKRNELLRQAFRIFDEDGNGYIDALELKRVLQCLGLDNGWDMDQIESMLKVVDLNLDGKVDFTEFELMMA